jgi:hypothetical protein
MRWLHTRFARFALHWSRIVRTIFFHLVVIRVTQAKPRPASPPRRNSSFTRRPLPFSSSGEALPGGMLVRSRGSSDSLPQIEHEPVGMPRGRAVSLSSNLASYGTRPVSGALSTWELLAASDPQLEFGQLQLQFEASVAALRHLATAAPSTAAGVSPRACTQRLRVVYSPL